jgi:23S rRNA pseudouridine1911/1915/1917 synthase
MRRLEVTDSDIRIDKYISLNTFYSREAVNKMLQEDYILVNEKKVKPSYKVKLNDIITIKDGFIKDINVVPQKMDIDIVYEDDDLMVINKPSGLVVHPGNGNYDNTLVNGLLYYTNNLSDSDTRPGIVHRLDKDTSGLMLVAKSNKAHELLSLDFKEKKVYREYVALLDGIFPQKSAIIDAPIARSNENFQKMAVMENGKHAVTHLEVLKKYKENTLVKVWLETGRTHQIRVHLSYIGYPVHNDPVYSKKKCDEFGQFLHSRYIKFIHPITHEVLEFSCPVPKHFQDYLDTLDETN